MTVASLTLCWECADTLTASADLLKALVRPLVCPCVAKTQDYAYGAGGFAAWGIMPNARLIFEVRG